MATNNCNAPAQLTVDEVIDYFAKIRWMRAAADEDFAAGAANAAAAFEALKSWYLRATTPALYEDLDNDSQRCTFGFGLTIGGQEFNLPAIYSGDEAWYNLVMDFISALEHYYDSMVPESC